MKYLCLVYHEEQPGESQNGSELDAMSDDILDFSEELRKSGHFIAAAPLQPAQAATTIRIWNGKVSISDSLLPRTKEQLSAFFVIEARDLNDAIRIAAKAPPFRAGSIEVRPVQERT